MDHEQLTGLVQAAGTRRNLIGEPRSFGPAVFAKYVCKRIMRIELLGGQHMVQGRD